MRRRRAAAILLAVCLGLLLSAARTHAGGDAGAAEMFFVTAVNAERVAAGERPLVENPVLSTLARTWSARMADTKLLAHDPSMAATAPPGWVKLGENVGVVTSDLGVLQAAFMASPAHAANVTDPLYQALGVGVVFTDEAVYVTVRFQAVARTRFNRYERDCC